MEVISVISSKLGKYPSQLRSILFEDTARSPEQDIYCFGSNVYQRRVEIISWTKLFNIQKCWQQAYMNKSPIDNNCKWYKGAWSYSSTSTEPLQLSQ